MSKKENLTGAQIIAQCLVDHGVDRVYTIPGAKIDALHNAILDTPISMVVCRHEQNAAFMAAAYGRITGKPGIVIVTSGPGVTNLTTGLLTATSEGDPVIAIGGNAPIKMIERSTHQSAKNSLILEHATKQSIAIKNINNVALVIRNSFFAATTPRAGACFVSVPQDILTETCQMDEISTTPICFEKTIAQNSTLEKIAVELKNAKSPLLILGNEASHKENAEAVRLLLKHYNVACVSTFQASGIITEDLAHLWFGRVGLFKNQLGDKIIQMSDLIVCLGFDTLEYDPETWCIPKQHRIIHINEYVPVIREEYNPFILCPGNIANNLDVVRGILPQRSKINDALDNKKSLFNRNPILSTSKKEGHIHPIEFIDQLQNKINKETIVISDIGTHYMWLAHHLKIHTPRSFMTSNGQQTLGVSLPWAIGAYFANKKDIISISGDGGFLFSAMELETAVREEARFTHFVWVDGYYDMVKEQQNMKYNRCAAVKLGEIDIVKFAESFGAKGIKLESVEQISEIIDTGRNLTTPTIVEVPINYDDNHYLFKIADEKAVLH